MNIASHASLLVRELSNVCRRPTSGAASQDFSVTALRLPKAPFNERRYGPFAIVADAIHRLPCEPRRCRDRTDAFSLREHVRDYVELLPREARLPTLVM